MSEDKKFTPDIIIVSDVGQGSSIATQLALEKSKEMGSVIVVDSNNVDELKKNLINQIPPTPFINYLKEIPELTQITIADDSKPCNPYPSPKGRRGKRRW